MKSENQEFCQKRDKIEYSCSLNLMGHAEQTKPTGDLQN